MKPFWRGFFSIFDFSWFSWPLSSSPRIKKMIEESKRREQWYHKGEWWEHPLYGDAYKRKAKK